MPFDGVRGGAATPLTTLDALAETLTAKPPPSDPPAVFRWAEHEAVYLLRFGSAAAQKAALTRLSMFLEDATHRNTVLPAVPTGRVAGPASYSGHNCRAEDAARFFAQAKDAGVALSAAEEELKALLIMHRVLIPARDGRLGGAAGVCVLSVARGGARDEARGTLLHEAMHGLFYAHAAFADDCWRFWREALTEPERMTWRGFLAGLGYDATCEELCVNEFQAYMATERTLFGGGGGGGASSGGSKRRGASAASGGAGDAAALAGTQRAFAAFIAPRVPPPPPRLAGCTCVFADPAFACEAGKAGPFRLPK